MEQNESNFNLSSTGVIPLISNNSFELNAISLSDDSGFTSHNRENEVMFLHTIIYYYIQYI